MAANDQGFLPTRRSLLDRIKDPNDSKSWEEFYNTYSRLILGVAKRAGLTECEAQDVRQETMRAVSKTIGDFDYDPAKGRFKSWLRRLTEWKITDQFRKRLPVVHKAGGRDDESTRTPTEGGIPDPRAADLERIWTDEWMKNLSERATERVKQSVSAKQYQIFDLYVVKEWPAEKVAAALGVKTAQVFLAKHRLMKLIKQEVSRLEEETGF